MSDIDDLLIIGQAGFGMLPAVLYGIGALSSEGAITMGLGFVAGYVAILTGRVIEVREAIRDG